MIRMFNNRQQYQTLDERKAGIVMTPGQNSRRTTFSPAPLIRFRTLTPSHRDQRLIPISSRYQQNSRRPTFSPRPFRKVVIDGTPEHKRARRPTVNAQLSPSPTKKSTISRALEYFVSVYFNG